MFLYVSVPSSRSDTQTRLKSLDLIPACVRAHTHTESHLTVVMSARVSIHSIKWREVMEASTREIYELAVKLLLFATNCSGLSTHCFLGGGAPLLSVQRAFSLLRPDF